MAAFHVFVDGAADRSPAGVERLAAAIAEHYGLPVAELTKRIASGRFRVKGNCDRATADTYVADLTRLGARCSLEDATPQNRANTPLPFPARPAASKPMQSGLAAAFSGETPAASLGALDDGGMLKLSSVDGAEDRKPPAAAAFTPPAPAAAAKPAPAAPPVDMFAPPDAEAEAAFKVELAPDEIVRAAKKRASIPPADVAPIEPAAPSRISRPSMQPPVADAPRGRMADPKLRFALGVLVAIVLGFIPATLIASARERSVFGEIDDKIERQQQEAQTPDEYDALDGFRANQLARKHDERRTIAILAFLIWGAAGGGVAYVWFRRIRWD